MHPEHKVLGTWAVSDGCFLHRAIGYVMSSLFYPLFTFFLLAMVIAYWAVTAVYPPSPLLLITSV